MNSSTFRTFERRKQQEEIKRQIELLKSQLDDSEPDKKEESEAPLSEKNSKRKSENDSGKGKGVMLAPNTPSPRKKRKTSHSPSTRGPIPKLVFQSKSSSSSSKPHTTTAQPSSTTSQLTTPAASAAFSTLRRLEKAAATAEDENDRKERIERTVGFGEKPALTQPIPQGDDAATGQQRDERLALVEDFEMGPYEFSPPVDDPKFEGFEPHSGMALSSRILPHADLSDYLSGRFYISPSKLYSLLRVDPSSSSNTHTNNKGGYDLDVPVSGDWVTIAVIAERGPIKYTKAPVRVDKDEEEDKKNKKKKWDASRSRKPPPPPEEEEGVRGGGKKYVTLKMIDFGARTESSGGGGYKPIRGDGFLNLILFEADRVDFISEGTGIRKNGKERVEKVYKGGSGGAFEKLMDVREGDVVALLNPRVMRPYQRTQPSSGQTTILALTPPTASSIVVIGRSRDLGRCSVLKVDGKLCGAWCDRRAVAGSREQDKDKGGGVCEYHLEKAVMTRRAGRNEFAIGTSGMSTSATHKRKHDYDPLRKWGLKPNESGSNSGGNSGATYVFSGHVVSNNNVAASMFVNESVGREAQARARRKMGGGKMKEEEKVLVSRMIGKGRFKDRESEEEEEEEEATKTKEKEKKAKPLYSADFVKKLGFDPSLVGGKGKGGVCGNEINKSVQNKLDALKRGRTKKVELGPRPGERIRSGVVAPVPTVASGSDSKEQDDEKMVDLDDL